MRDKVGIILAGGSGTRLWPITTATTKQLLPVYDKPMIYYPLTTLMLADIKDIIIITAPRDLERFKTLLKDGSQWGININYLVQEKPDGIASSFLIAENFIKNKLCCLILGDNIFYGSGLSSLLTEASRNEDGAINFTYYVDNPEQFGVCVFDKFGKPIEIIEKPKNFISNWAVTGIYFYDSEVLEIAKSIKPSARGELEISSINQVYLENKKLKLKKLSRGYAWLDTGNIDDLLRASNFVKSIQQIQGLKIGCPEEVAWRMGLISSEDLERLILDYKGVDYAYYLSSILHENS